MRAWAAWTPPRPGRWFAAQRRPGAGRSGRDGGSHHDAEALDGFSVHQVDRADLSEGLVAIGACLAARVVTRPDSLQDAPHRVDLGVAGRLVVVAEDGAQPDQVIAAGLLQTVDQRQGLLARGDV